jgi:hypothetical protein
MVNQEAGAVSSGVAGSDSGGGGHASPAEVRDKLVWTLVRPERTGFTDFQRYVLEDLAQAVGSLVAGTTQVRVTLQERHAFSGALVRIGDTDRRIDAVLQVISADSYVATDPVNAVLLANCGHVQGWRVQPTTMDDSSPEVALGKPSPFVQALWMNQRIDGVTPEFYSRNWYIHGGHPDGLAAETAESRANRKEMEARGMQRWYIQNRVLEPITPTAWVINGFADLTFPSLLPIVGERYDPKAGFSEEHFDRWPPRVIQGAAYRVI